MEHNAGPTWKPDAALSQLLDAAKTRALREGRAVLTADDIERAIDNGESVRVPERISAGTAGRVRLDETARQLLRAKGDDGTVTAAEVRARLLGGRRHRPQPFDTVEEWLMAELRAWRLMAAAAEIHYGSAAFCPPGERRADPERAEAMRAEARRQIEAVGERLTMTDWHPRRNPLTRLGAEHGLCRLAGRCMLVLYLHREFGIWSNRGAPVGLEDLARAVVGTVGETDLIEAATRQLEESGLMFITGDGLGMGSLAPAESCLVAFRAAAAGDCPSALLRPARSFFKRPSDHYGRFRQRDEGCGR